MCRRGFFAALPVLVYVCISGIAEIAAAQQPEYHLPVSASLKESPDSAAVATGRNLSGAEEAISRIAAQMVEDNILNGLPSARIQEQAEYIESCLGDLYRNPIDLNRADFGLLRRILFLSDFQIESLIAYRKAHGNILSFSELSLIQGFDESLVELLRYFVFLDGGLGGVKRSSFTNEFYMRTSRVMEKEQMYKAISEQEFRKNPDSRYLGSPYHLIVKNVLSKGDIFKAGIVVEKDAGERMTLSVPFDYLSGYCMVNNIKAGNVAMDLLLGDFKARFGQGLTVWKGFGFSGIQLPGGFYKKGASIVPNSSVDEDNFFRGAALTVRYGHAESSVFVSYRKRDAALSWDSVHGRFKYTSLQSDGLHNIMSRYKNRKNMGDLVFGGSVAKRAERVRVSLNFTAQKFEYDSGKKVREDNKYQLYNGFSGSVSSDFAFVAGKNIVFGEIASDIGWSTAFLIGVNSRAIDKWDLSLFLRRYSKSYIAPNAGAYSTLSGCHNQTGFCITALKNISAVSKISIFSEYVYYPGARFNIPAKSHYLKYSSLFDYRSENYSFQARFSSTYSSTDKVFSLKVRWFLSYDASRCFLLKFQNENILKAKDSGVYVSFLARYKRPGISPLSIIASGTLFRNTGWRSRSYIYEYDLPQSYSSQLLYGRGYKLYLMCRSRIFNGVELFAKLETLRFFSVKERDKKTGSVVSLTKEPVSKIKAGIRLNL